MYLKTSLDKLKSLSGNLLVLGCSFSDNDKHVFSKIKESKIDKIYSDVYTGASQNKDKIIQERGLLFFI